MTIESLEDQNIKKLAVYPLLLYWVQDLGVKMEIMNKVDTNLIDHIKIYFPGIKE